MLSVNDVPEPNSNLPLVKKIPKKEKKNNDTRIHFAQRASQKYKTNYPVQS